MAIIKTSTMDDLTYTPGFMHYMYNYNRNYYSSCASSVIILVERLEQLPLKFGDMKKLF